MKKAFTTEAAAIKNKITYDLFFSRLAEIAINRFKWDGLPDGDPGISTRYLEMALFGNGKAVFFEDTEIGSPLALKCSTLSNFDVYGNPYSVQAYGYNGYTVGLDREKCVVVYNNYLRSPSFPLVDLYAKQLTEIQRAIDTNTTLQKFPGLAITDDKQRLTIGNLLLKWQTNVPIIIGTKAIDPQNFQYIDFKVPFVADKLQILKRQVWNEALTFLGIYNANTEKKERMVDSEITSNLGGVNASRLTGLIARQEACKECKIKFGWDMFVSFNEELDLFMPFREEGENGSLYDTNQDDLRRNLSEQAKSEPGNANA